MKKDMSELMKQAHKMAKMIKREFKDVDYKTQLGICMSYLLNCEDEKIDEERAVELSNDLNISIEEAKQLVEVEKHYQNEYSYGRECHIKFSIWEGYGKRRAYIKLPWRCKYANSFKSNYDFGTHYLQDRYDSKQF